MNKNYFDLSQYEKEEVSRLEQIKYFKESMGRELLSFLEDDEIIEIMLNQDGSIWVEKFGHGIIKTDVTLSKSKGRQLIEIIAGYNGEVINKKNPALTAILPEGERFEAILYRSVKDNPIFSIRKRPKKIFTLEEYVRQGILKESHKDILKEFIGQKKNILVIGGTSSGKTTFVNACLDELKDTKDRVFLIEEIPELKCDAANKVELIVSEELSMQNLIQRSMRLNPSRITIGELRKGEETQSLLKAWNSGHPGGFSTIHADSCQDGLTKLEQYLSEVNVGYMQSYVIASSVNILVFMASENGKRMVKEVKILKKYDKKNQEYILEDVS